MPHHGRPTVSTMICAQELAEDSSSTSRELDAWFTAYPTITLYAVIHINWPSIAKTYGNSLLDNNCKCIVNNLFLIKWLLVLENEFPMTLVSGLSVLGDNPGNMTTHQQGFPTYLLELLWNHLQRVESRQAITSDT